MNICTTDQTVHTTLQVCRCLILSLIAEALWDNLCGRPPLKGRLHIAQLLFGRDIPHHIGEQSPLIVRKLTIHYLLDLIEVFRL